MTEPMRHFVTKLWSCPPPSGYLAKLPYWSVITAYGFAAAEHVDLSAKHFEVIQYLREYYTVHGPNQSASKVLKELDIAFAAQGGRKYLYRLFPGGPVTQATRIAGLPLPRNCLDPSFGSVH